MTDQKQLDNVEYFNNLGNIIKKKDATITRKIESRIALAKAANNRKTFFTSKLDLHLRKEI
jgi:hypothetical protein